MLVPEGVRGQKMHFWVEARLEQRPVPSVNSHFLIRNLQKAQFANSLTALKIITTQLRRFDIKHDKDNAYLD